MAARVSPELLFLRLNQKRRLSWWTARRLASTKMGTHWTPWDHGGLDSRYGHRELVVPDFCTFWAGPIPDHVVNFADVKGLYSPIRNAWAYPVSHSIYESLAFAWRAHISLIMSCIIYMWFSASILYTAITDGLTPSPCMVPKVGSQPGMFSWQISWQIQAVQAMSDRRAAENLR